MKTLIKYEGVTNRGRRVSEDSLQEAVESLAFVANRDASKCVTLQDGDGCWYVYPSQGELDADGPSKMFSNERIRWFAFITLRAVLP